MSVAGETTFERNQSRSPGNETNDWLQTSWLIINSETRLAFAMNAANKISFVSRFSSSSAAEIKYKPQAKRHAVHVSTSICRLSPSVFATPPLTPH